MGTRWVLVVAALLSFATGIAVSEARLAFAPPPDAVAHGSAEARDAGLARQFYRGLQAALDGDPEVLASVLAPDFLEHGCAPGGATTALPARAVAFGELFPGSTLTVEEIIPGRERLSARYALEPGASTANDWQITGMGQWTTTDVLRLAGGRVAERWCAEPDRLVMMGQGTADDVEATGSGIRRFTVELFEMGPGSAISITQRDGERRWVWVTKGQATVKRPGAAPETLTGEMATESGSGTFTVEQNGREPARVLVATLAPLASPSTGVPGAWVAGGPVEREVVAKGDVDVPAGVTLDAHWRQVVLTAGTTLSWLGEGGVQAIVPLGGAAVATIGGSGWVPHGGSGVRASERAELLRAPDWLIASGGAVTLTANGDGGAELLVVELPWK